MSRRALSLLACAAMLVVGVFAAPALARHARAAARADAPAPGSLNTEFVSRNTAANQLEIQTGQLAQTNAASGDVKAFGAMLVSDHTAQQNALAAIAGQLGVAVPAELPSSEAQMVQDLSAQTGAAFDRAFLRLQVNAHSQVIGFNTKVGSNPALDDALGEYAATGAPVLLRHLRVARMLLATTPGSRQ